MIHTISTLYRHCFYDQFKKLIKMVINILEKCQKGYYYAFIKETKQTTKDYIKGSFYTGMFTQFFV